jgi:hypothetical protein
LLGLIRLHLTALLREAIPHGIIGQFLTLTALFLELRESRG